MKIPFISFFLACSCCCMALPHKTITYEIDEDTIVREYVVHEPTVYQKNQPRGLIIFLHGLGGKIDDHAQLAQNFADQYGWICAMPQSCSYINLDKDSIQKMLPGTQLPAEIEFVLGITAWNSGISSETIGEAIVPLLNQYITDKFAALGVAMLLGQEFEKWEETDDEQFILDMLEQVKKDYTIAEDSVFIAGMSMGGFMTHRMLINQGQYFNAGVAVSGLIGDDLMEDAPEHGAHPRIMQIHGTKDDVVGYDGKSGISGITAQVGLGAEETVAYWRQYNDCDSVPEVYYYPDLKADGMTFERYTYGGGADGSCVAFIKVNNGRHEWYGHTDNKDIDYAKEIYQFCANKKTVVTAVPSESLTLSDTQPNKVMEKGQLYIRKGGEQYNILGLRK